MGLQEKTMLAKRQKEADERIEKEAFENFKKTATDEDYKQEGFLKKHGKIKLKVKTNESIIPAIPIGVEQNKHEVLAEKLKQRQAEGARQNDIQNNENQKEKSILPEKSTSEILPEIHKPGWLIQRTDTMNIDMGYIPPNLSKVPQGLLPKLRKVVAKKNSRFVEKKESYKLKNNKQHFRQLDSRAAAYTLPLMHQFLAASSAYSCATPDNRIKLKVETLEQIQRKDNRLRDEESQNIQAMLQKSKDKYKETQHRVNLMSAKLNKLREKLKANEPGENDMIPIDGTPGTVTKVDSKVNRVRSP